VSTTTWIIIILAFFLFFGFLKSKAKFRRIVEDFEADLFPTNLNDFARAGKGEVERELYADGSSELKLQFSRTNLPEGATVSLIINGTKTGDFEVSKGRVYKKINTQSGQTVPNVKEGDMAEVEYNGTVILSGSFYPD